MKFRKTNKDRQTDKRAGQTVSKHEQTARDTSYMLQDTRYKDTFLARALNKYTKVSQYLGSPGQSQSHSQGTDPDPDRTYTSLFGAGARVCRRLSIRYTCSCSILPVW